MLGAKLVVNRITVGRFAFLFNCMPAGLNLRLYEGSDLKTYLQLSLSTGPDLVSVVGPTGV